MSDTSSDRPRPSPTPHRRHGADDDDVEPAVDQTASDDSVGGAHAAAAEPEEAATDEAATEDAASDDAPSATRRPASRRRRGPLRRWVDADRVGSRRAGLVAAVAGVLAVLVAVLVVVLIVHHDSSSNPSGTSANAVDQQLAALDDEGAAQAFVAGATSDIASVTTYSYQTLSSDLYNGLAVTTGTYRARYRAALTGSLGSTVRRLHRTQNFDLGAAGIGRMSADGREAHVLVFGTQSIMDDTTKGKTEKSLVTLDATVERSGDTYLISALEAGGNAGLPPGTTGLTAAAEAAREEIGNLLTMRRAHLQADFRAALGHAVDPLRAQLAGQAGPVRAKLTKGGYDLSGEVTALAVQSTAGTSATMLVAATGNRVTSAGKSTVITDGRYQVQVVRTSDGWRVSQVVPITVS